MSEAKGNALVEQAERRLGSFSLFGSGKQKQDAMELFDNAATQFKVAKLWPNAATTYQRAAEIAIQLNLDLEATEFYRSAASMFKLSDQTDEAVALYRLLGERMMGNNSFTAAAKSFKTIGELYEEERDYSQSLAAYKRAADCYIAEDQETSSSQMLLKAAHLSALLKDYTSAIQLFEDVADKSVNNRLAKWSCPKYYFNALLCGLAKHADKGDVDEVENKLFQYQSSYPALEGSREEKFVLQLIVAVRELSLDAFQDAVYDYDRVSKLDDWQSGLLIAVKNAVRSGGDVDEDELLG